jgi:hypothetical protein
MGLRLCVHGCGRVVASRQRCACRSTIYSPQWEAHSRQRRTEQMWCEDCGATDDLTVDHPTDDVLCRACNSSRGHTTSG